MRYTLNHRIWSQCWVDKFKDCQQHVECRRSGQPRETNWGYSRGQTSTRSYKTRNDYILTFLVEQSHHNDTWPRISLSICYNHIVYNPWLYTYAHIAGLCGKTGLWSMCTHESYTSMSRLQYTVCKLECPRTPRWTQQWQQAVTVVMRSTSRFSCCAEESWEEGGKEESGRNWGTCSMHALTSDCKHCPDWSTSFIV